MKKAYVVENFIKIDAMTLKNIINHSGLNLKMLRTGNKYHSTRSTCIIDKYKNKRNWTVVAYSYSKVTDPRCYDGRELDIAENYLNPDFKYLLNK